MHRRNHDLPAHPAGYSGFDGHPVSGLTASSQVVSATRLLRNKWNGPFHDRTLILQILLETCRKSRGKILYKTRVSNMERTIKNQTLPHVYCTYFPIDLTQYSCDPLLRKIVTIFSYVHFVVFICTFSYSKWKMAKKYHESYSTASYIINFLQEPSVIKSVVSILTESLLAIKGYKHRLL
jgi:hypothetical protein